MPTLRWNPSFPNEVLQGDGRIIKAGQTFTISDEKEAREALAHPHIELAAEKQEKQVEKPPSPPTGLATPTEQGEK